MRPKLQRVVPAVVVALSSSFAPAAPPFSGTIFLDPDIITAADPSLFLGAPSAGRGRRTMFDRRSGWIEVDAYLFEATFADGLAAEIQVNPEFTSVDAAAAEAQKYGEVIGRLPTGLRIEVETVWIHKGTQPFGGGNQNLLIHTGQADLYVRDEILEETLAHEASHTSLDEAHAAAPGWLAAQGADQEFISSYARDNPTREDIAESFLPYLAVRYRRERVSAELAATILKTIPNRLAYFEDLKLDARPLGQSSQLRFVRGDANTDGTIDIGDGVFILLHLFRGNVPSLCVQTEDFDGSGKLDLADAIGSFQYLFRLGPQPVPPFPECDVAGAGETLGCLDYPSCDLNRR